MTAAVLLPDLQDCFMFLSRYVTAAWSDRQALHLSRASVSQTGFSALPHRPLAATSGGVSHDTKWQQHWPRRTTAGKGSFFSDFLDSWEKWWGRVAIFCLIIKCITLPQCVYIHKLSCKSVYYFWIKKAICIFRWNKITNSMSMSFKLGALASNLSSWV